MIILFIIFVLFIYLLPFLLVKFLDLNEKETEEYYEHVAGREGYPMDQNFPGSNWPRSF
jgi:hypothetical protein